MILRSKDYHRSMSQAQTTIERHLTMRMRTIYANFIYWSPFWQDASSITPHEKDLESTKISLHLYLQSNLAGMTMVIICIPRTSLYSILGHPTPRATSQKIPTIPYCAFVRFFKSPTPLYYFALRMKIGSLWHPPRCRTIGGSASRPVLLTTDAQPQKFGVAIYKPIISLVKVRILNRQISKEKPYPMVHWFSAADLTNINRRGGCYPLCTVFR